MRSLTIGAKLTLVSVVATVLLLAAAVLLISNKVRVITEDQAHQIGRSVGDIVAKEILRDLEATYQTSEVLVNEIRLAKELGLVDRRHLAKTIEATVAANPKLMGSWIGMEPDGLGDSDESFIGAPHSDPKSGQFAFYVNRGGAGGSIHKRPMKIAGMDKNDPSNAWYTDALLSKKPSYTEPTIYPDIGGKEAMLVDVGVPIIVNGKAVGVAGTDVEMLNVSARLAEIRPLKTGNVFLISAKGNWVGYAERDHLGKPIDQAIPDLAAFKPAIGRGEQIEVERFSPSLDTDVLTYFLPMKLPGSDQSWSVMVNIPQETIGQATYETRTLILVVFAVLVVGVSVALMFSSTFLVKRPLHQTIESIEALGRQEYDKEVQGQERTDEAGSIARALEGFRENLKRIKILEQEQMEAERRASRERAEARRQMADEFEGSVGEIVNTVGASAQEMEATSQEMTRVAHQTMEQALTVANAAGDASRNVATVASASEELSSSISEISSQVQRSAEIANQAVGQSEEANQRVRSLVSAAERIGEVVTLITDIAEQTNLLALNATIEAARAGDAGKGFAVVASEVKNLAKQTARATDEISQQITAIQTETQSSVTAIEGIGDTINSINDIAATIAAAVEEQGAATQEIARSVQQAAAGTNEVTDNISGVRTASEETGHSASEVQVASSMLAQESQSLSRQVDEFLAQIRA